MMRTLMPTVAIAGALTGTMAWACGDVQNAAAVEATRGPSDQQERTMKLRLIIEGTSLAATLVDSETARDFASLLPLSLTLKDYAETEKISDLPRKLSTKGAPAGTAPSVGDIAYYAPWGNLALFHKDFGYSSGLIKLGTIDAGVEVLRRPGPLKVTIERVQDVGSRPHHP